MVTMLLPENYASAWEPVVHKIGDKLEIKTIRINSALQLTIILESACWFLCSKN